MHDNLQTEFGIGSTKQSKAESITLTEHEKDQILAFQESILKSVLQNLNPLEIINNICKLEEQMSPNSVASVMLLNEQQCLSVLAAPNIPPEVINRLNGLRPSPTGGSCANVIYRQEAVYVADTLTDPKWLDLRQLAHEFDLKACWSVPIRGAEDKIIGTFALSSFEYGWPTNFHRKLLEIGASIVGIVLERDQQAESLRLSSQVFENSGESIMITDANQHILSVNQTFTYMFGFNAEEIIGQTPKVLKSFRHNTDYYKEMWHCLAQNGFWQDEIWSKNKHGEIKPFLLGITAVSNTASAITHYIAIYSDLSTQKQAQAQIEFLGFHDALTALPNRILAKDRVELAMLAAHRNHTKIALLVLDIDYFNTINDSLGHPVGDKLIKAVAERLSECLRDTDTLSRQGGDEFLIMLPNIRDDNAITYVLERIATSMGQPFIVDTHELPVSLSIGITMYPDDGEDFDTLLRTADIALHRAKAAGRNTYRFHTKQMNIDTLERLSLSNGMRHALTLNQFSLHYQAQLDLNSGAIIGAEALIRWNHPKLGLIAPGRFIPIAEDNGMIVEIGAWVLHEACRQTAAWHRTGLPEFTIAVNLSAIQFRRGNLVANVVHALADSGLNPTLLELELTESILMQNTEHILSTVQQLKALGVQLSIDDFGTGYSSLSYLKRFNVDKLKIDQSFIRDLAENPSDTAIIRAIIQMARGLNLKTIAEGVETDEQLSLLRFECCDEAQGYHFTKPLPGPDFLLYYLDHLNARANQVPTRN
ncbi:MAG: bifunctional diguanylate cyclase/phosphodiesterase [Sulfuriferula sp.]